MKELLKKVTEGQNLTREEAAKAMDMMLEGTASPVLVSAFLTAPVSYTHLTLPTN